MPEMVEWQMWRQLKGAFAIDRFIFVPRVHKMQGYTFDQADSMGQALEMANEAYVRVFLEPTGLNSIAELGSLNNNPDANVVFVLGNTVSSNREYAQSHECFRINTQGDTDLYGINAAAIALAYWYGQ